MTELADRLVQEAADMRTATLERPDTTTPPEPAELPSELPEQPEPQPVAPDPKENDDDDSDDEDVPVGTVNEISTWVANDPDRAARALKAEHEGKRRITLLHHLEAVAASD